MEDLDALLDELQSSTSSSSQNLPQDVRLNTSLPLEKPAIGMYGRSPYQAEDHVGSAEALDAEGQPIYEFQSVKPERVSHVMPPTAVISSSHAPVVYASVHRPGPPPTASLTPAQSTRSVATLSSNLSELDSLLQELSSAQLQAEVDRLNPTADPRRNLPGANNQMAGSTPNARAPSQKTVSSATRELDDLMASLSDLDVQESLSPPYGRGTEPPTAPVPLTAGQPVNRTIAAAAASAASSVAGGGCSVPSVQNVSAVPSAGAVPPSATTLPSVNSLNLNALMEDLDKNMMQQGVTTIPKGHCSACAKPIVGKVITALGRLWHPEHFVCVHCKEPLGARNFFERDTLPYCEEDYHLLFSPRCAFCDGPILDKCVTAMDRTWHPEHFTCAQCGCLLGPEIGFHEKDGLAYCGNDFYEMFAPKCGGCGRPIVENFITALNQQWHTHCFVCSECRMPFGASSFYDHEGLPYCETHFHARRGSLCAGCHKPVTGRCITAMYRKYHPEHFVCTYCSRQLNKGTFKEQQDKPYCHPCFVRLFS